MAGWSRGTTWSVVGGAIFCLAVAGAIFWRSSFTSGVVNVISIAGTLASLFGLVLVLLQVSSLADISREAKRASESTRDSLLDFLSTLDVSRTVRIAEEAQTYARLKKIELAMIRMNDLRYQLIGIRNNPSLCNLIDADAYGDLATKISISVASIDKGLSNPGSIDTHLLYRILDEILGNLIDLDTKLRNRNRSL